MFVFIAGFAQEPTTYHIFKNEPLNFNGKQGGDTAVQRFASGRIIYKKITVPKFKKGTDVTIKLTVRSNGDRWDKSGSCFVISDTSTISIVDVAKGKATFPKASFEGVKSTETYQPVVELLRFMTPFGVGHYSVAEDKHRRPVYVPKWEKQVVWEQDISQLISLVSNTFYVGIWIDSWTSEGYSVDLSLAYSNRPLHKLKVLPLVNSVSYVNGQKLPDFFAHKPLEQQFTIPKGAKKVKLHYITTGHGGHSGGDEFTKIRNRVFVDNKLMLDTIPWRDDCASFRRFNPTSGVWLKKDSASYIDWKVKKYKVKEIEERIASSDLSRSNWCPGSSVKPMVIELKDVQAGKHTLKIAIDATEAVGDKLNHWLVSAYLTYE